jgi:hypothetical protein
VAGDPDWSGWYLQGVLGPRRCSLLLRWTSGVGCAGGRRRGRGVGVCERRGEGHEGGATTGAGSKVCCDMLGSRWDHISEGDVQWAVYCCCERV